MNSNPAKNIILLSGFLLLLSCFNLKSQIVVNESKNKLETYRVSWWNLPISFGLSGNWARPMYGVIDLDNGELNLRHAIMEGRPLGDYRLPYWPKRSFVSICSQSAELAHQSTVSFFREGKRDTLPFRCGDPRYFGSDDKLFNRMKRIDEGFEVAQYKASDILKVSNKGSESPVLMEHSFVISPGSRDIPVFIKATNQTNYTIEDVVVDVSYNQDFNWSSFGIARSDNYKPVIAPASGKTNSFFAFSSGMERGFEFHEVKGGKLSYEIREEFNEWEVKIENSPVTLAPGETFVFEYHIRILDQAVQKTSDSDFISGKDFDLLEYKYRIPVEIKSPAVKTDQRITIQDMIRKIHEPKARGLHCISGSRALDDLERLKDWGGNLAVAGPHAGGNLQEARQIIKRGNELGMEMLVAGEGAYWTGLPPSFDQLFSADLSPSEFPDAYGQDEDHTYWYAARPLLDFEEIFNKPMSAATTEEKAIYWSRCFVEKWRITLEEVRSNDPDGNIWFYMPMPSLANIDPLDYHDPFLKEVSGLGDALTVLPFYYGDDYNQIEYMMRRWKDAGARRALFLPGAPTYSRPSQYFRAITAARRGGADGACGFAFSMSVYDQFGFVSFDHDWRWKSLMLASLANFPTTELGAYSLLEEPAELIQALAISDIILFSENSEAKKLCYELETLVPGQVEFRHGFPDKKPLNDQLYILVGDNPDLENLKISYTMNKGVIQMKDNVVRINGSGKKGLQNAERLLLRFAEMAKVESFYR